MATDVSKYPDPRAWAAMRFVRTRDRLQLATDARGRAEDYAERLRKDPTVSEKAREIAGRSVANAITVQEEAEKSYYGACELGAVMRRGQLEVEDKRRRLSAHFFEMLVECEARALCIEIGVDPDSKLEDFESRLAQTPVTRQVAS